MSSKLQTLMQITSMDREMLAQQAVMEDQSSGICMNKGCSYVCKIEPAAKETWCPMCETNSMMSCGSLLGIH